MKRKLYLSLFFVVSTALFAEGTSAGGGISVFIPENLYKYGNGTIAFEQGLSTALGIGSILSIPIGFSYHSTDGYMLEHDKTAKLEAPAFYGDSIIPYLMLKAKVSIGPVFYLEAFGGGALNWGFLDEADRLLRRRLRIRGGPEDRHQFGHYRKKYRLRMARRVERPA